MKHSKPTVSINLRNKNEIYHRKSVRKVSFIDEDLFVTGSADSVIKLWKSGHSSSSVRNE